MWSLTIAPPPGVFYAIINWPFYPLTTQHPDVSLGEEVYDIASSETPLLISLRSYLRKWSRVIAIPLSFPPPPHTGRIHALWCHSFVTLSLTPSVLLHGNYVPTYKTTRSAPPSPFFSTPQLPQRTFICICFCCCLFVCFPLFFVAFVGSGARLPLFLFVFPLSLVFIATHISGARVHRHYSCIVPRSDRRSNSERAKASADTTRRLPT
jgi:hypothetical protein